MTTSNHKKAKVLCLSNHKGGVGKTCSTCNIGAGLAKRGKKVLLIDLDPQANLSLSLGLTEVEKNVYFVLLNQCPIEEAIYNITENLDIVPSNLDLAGAEIELSSEAGREMILKECLNQISNQYDYILIDCAPSLGLLTINALTASNEVYIPLQAQYLSLQGISKLTTIIEKIQRRLNENLKIGGIFITQYDARKVLNRDIAESIEKYFSKDVLKTKIRDNITLAEAPGHGKDIFRYSPKSYGAEDYASLCDEILTR
ncbi:MAG: Sporulation initiation inhibitor protein Soj [Chlamydiae bacterium]|nr:Sporulation initiation inhibitor protein Soj [Chlamydiota bacterium]